MKAMMLAFLACAVITAAAPMVLRELGYTSEAMWAGDAVRLSDAKE
jgi:hypothetical protein